MNEALLAFEACELDVVSVTSDQGGKNRGLANQLGISTEQSYFDHPIISVKGIMALRKIIFWFWDILHLLKLLRLFKILSTGHFNH